ncbi:MAG: CCA tRNA nucleotidyltransferase [Candidatus Competibacteraceae bacterium]|nr:CCA tRNA nucleotidyltransferase [Candidatus Competibacteraceae bacterium]
MDNLITHVKAAYREVHRLELSEADAEKTVRALTPYRTFLTHLLDSPSRFFIDLFSSPQESMGVIPCDLIEFRRFLSDGIGSPSSERLAILPQKFVERYFNKLAVSLVIDLSKLRDINRSVRGVPTVKLPVEVGGAVRRVIVNALSGSDAVVAAKKILNNSGIKADFSVNHSVPGISSPHPKISSWNRLTKTAQTAAIPLNDKEQQIFDFLKQARDASAPGVEMRVAGGWVRDKMLGVESDDIDIAISRMSGFEFARAIETFAKQSGVAGVGSAYDVSLDKSAEPTEAEGNNAQLMVGGIPLFGLKVELVPMRTETYNEKSRKPIIDRTDNVLDDVVRRDLTINSMYYNIDSGQVEDYVGGIEDLKTMTLRTPTDPVKTFMDDPLRMLRVLRFHSKYPNSKIDPTIVEAMKLPELHQAYNTKVAPLRAGKEILKLMGGKNPEPAARILLETDLYKSVFDIPEMKGLNDIRMDQKNQNHKLNLMDHTLSVLKNVNRLMTENGESSETRIFMNLAALFHDFGKMHPEIAKPHPKRPDENQYIGHEDMSATIAESAMKAIGIGDQSRKFINKVIQMHMRPHAYPDNLKDKSIHKYIAEAKIPGMDQLDSNVEQGDDYEDRLENARRMKDLYKRIPILTYYHAIADSMAKGVDDWHADVSKKQHHIQRINEFIQMHGQRPPLAQILGQPVGQFVMGLFPGVDPKTGYIREVQQALDQVHALGQITAPNQAASIALGLGIEQRYGGGQVKTMSWFNKELKKAQSFGEGIGPGPGDDFNPYEGTPLANEDKEIVRVEHKYTKPARTGPSVEKLPNDIVRKNDVVRVPFGEGDIIRSRDRGLAEAQQFGRVVKIDNEFAHIKWQGKDEVEKVPLNETVYIAEKIQKV